MKHIRCEVKIIQQNIKVLLIECQLLRIFILYPTYLSISLFPLNLDEHMQTQAYITRLYEQNVQS